LVYIRNRGREINVWHSRNMIMRVLCTFSSQDGTPSARCVTQNALTNEICVLAPSSPHMDLFSSVCVTTSSLYQIKILFDLNIISCSSKHILNKYAENRFFLWHRQMLTSLTSLAVCESAFYLASNRAMYASQCAMRELPRVCCCFVDISIWF
jgi:hypothetical protein